MNLRKKIGIFCLTYFFSVSLCYGFVDYFQMRPGKKKDELFKNCQTLFGKAGFVKATKEYIKLAGEYALEPSQMALAFASKRPFIASVLLGATTVNQLETNLTSVEIKLSEEVLQGIEEIHNRIPNPCP